MKTVVWIVASSVLCALAAAAVLGPASGAEILFGILGPLVVAVASLIAMERTYRQDPGRLTSLMLVAFGGKMAFFAAYVAIGLRLLSLRPVPFVAAFTGGFIGLFVAQALTLRRLFAGPDQARALCAPRR